MSKICSHYLRKFSGFLKLIWQLKIIFNDSSKNIFDLPRVVKSQQNFKK